MMWYRFLMGFSLFLSFMKVWSPLRGQSLEHTASVQYLSTELAADRFTFEKGDTLLISPQLYEARKPNWPDVIKPVQNVCEYLKRRRGSYFSIRFQIYESPQNDLMVSVRLESVKRVRSSAKRNCATLTKTAHKLNAPPVRYAIRHDCQTDSWSLEVKPNP